MSPHGGGDRDPAEDQGRLYAGLLAEAYDLYLGADDPGDAPFYRDLIRGRAGTALELGCGTGRLLVPLLEGGLEVEGLDSSSEMLGRCRDKAAARGLSPVLHLAEMQRFSLGRTYETIFCAAGSFTLLAAPGAMVAALGAARQHLSPGGRIAISMDRPSAAKARPAGRQLARAAQRKADGALLRCWLERLPAPSPGVERRRMTNEAVLPGGATVRSETATIDFRPLEPRDFAALLVAESFADVEILGPRGERPAGPGHDAYIALAGVPAGSPAAR